MSLAYDIKLLFSTFPVFPGQQFMRKIDYFNLVTIKPRIR